MIVSYAQNREDLILEAYFSDVKKGFYVDVGANHPIEDSVTKLFYQKGWRGLNIEPNAALHSLLVFDRPHDGNLNIGVSNKAGELEFTEYANHGLSTFSSEMQKEYQASHSEFTDTFRKYTVPVMTLAEIFQQHTVPHIHFLKVDVEGYEYEVLEGNDWKNYRPDMICIESNHIVKDWRPLLQEQGYKKVFFDGLNDYYVSPEAVNREAHFSYPETMLLQGQIVSWQLQQEMTELTQERDLVKLHQRYERQFAHNGCSTHALGLRQTLRAFLAAFDNAVSRRLTIRRVSTAKFRAAQGIAFSQGTTQADLDMLAHSYHANVQIVQSGPSGVSQVLLKAAWFVYRFVRRALQLAAVALKKAARTRSAT